MGADGVGKMSHAAWEGPRALAGNEHLSAAGIVHAARQIGERQIRRPAILWSAVAEVRRLVSPDHVCSAERGAPCSGLYQAQHRRRRPLSLRARDGHGAVRIQAQAVRIAEAAGQDIDLLSIRRDAYQSLIGRGGVEIAGGIALQPANEISASRRSGVGVAETFIEVRLAVAVGVVQAGDLIASQNKYLTIRNDQ